MNLSAALLALGEHELARPHLRAGWAQAPLFDMQPYFADYLALLAAFDGRIDAAARLAGYGAAANAGAGERQPNEAAAHARAVQLARAALGDPTFDRLHAEGAALRDADVEALAFGEGNLRGQCRSLHRPAGRASAAARGVAPRMGRLGDALRAMQVGTTASLLHGTREG